MIGPCEVAIEGSGVKYFRVHIFFSTEYSIFGFDMDFYVER